MSRTWNARKPTEADRAMIEAWIRKDERHAGKMTPEAFLEGDTERGSEVMVIEDAHGPIMFVRATNVMRLTIQFPPLFEAPRGCSEPHPAGTPHEGAAKSGSMVEVSPGLWKPREDLGMRIRVAKALMAGLVWIKRHAIKSGYAELEYDSIEATLVHFFERQGFKKREDVYAARL